MVAMLLGVVLLLTFFVLLSTGSIIAVGVLWIMVAMVVFLLNTYGFLTAGILSPAAPVVQPVGSATSSLTNVTTVGSEVFHIADNKFTYDDAPAVCAAYDAQLASLEQILDAYNHGAEWCGYGWSAGGMALYPTQKSTWDALQQEVDPKKKTACGRPGVNGGYFDPTSKFGVNCYGFKPQGTIKLPTPLPGTDPTAFNALVSKFKATLKSFNLDPYSRATWSGAPTSAGQQFIDSVKKESFTVPVFGNVPDMEVLPGQTIANTGLPFGSPFMLRESTPATTDATTAAPVAGAAGAAGLAGAAGAAGSKGDKGDPGAAGAAGLAGAAGAAGPKGPTGATGEKGPKGDAGEYPGKIPIADTRTVNLSPAQYYAKGMGKYDEFKIRSTVGLPGDGFTEVTTTVPWWDTTGGPVIQAIPTGLTRSGTGATWSSWANGPIKISDRWTIQDEGVALTFRDALSGGDQRVAVFNKPGGKNI